MSQTVNRKETFYLVDHPTGDRLFIWHAISPEYYEKLKSEGASVYRIDVELPVVKNSDMVLTTSAKPWRGEFGDSE